jgi:Ca2+-binding RTX toxin-like protein
MIRRHLLTFSLWALILLIVSSAAFAFAGSIAVPASRLDQQWFNITVSDLAPAECDSISSAITAIIVCNGGNCDGTIANELILGTAGVDTIDGKNGLDCIVGGDGNDQINGGNDDDVLIGGNGNDDLNGGPRKDNDICYDGSGANVFNECDLMP